MANKIDILVVDPCKAPRPIQVEDTLEAFQQIVGGPIEAGCYLPQRVMLICNGDGKNMKLISQMIRIPVRAMSCGLAGMPKVSMPPKKPFPVSSRRYSQERSSPQKQR